MLPILLLVGGGALLFLAASGEKKQSDVSKFLPAIRWHEQLRGKAGEERKTIQGGINDGSLEEATGGAKDVIEGFNTPPLAGASSGAGIGMAAFGPLGAVVGAVIGAFAQNIVRLIEGSDVGDVIDTEIKRALKSADLATSPENITFARHLLVLKQWPEELSVWNHRLAVPVDGGFPLPEHSWGILFRRWMQDYLTGDARSNLGGPRAPRRSLNEDRMFLGFIPAAGGAEQPADGMWEMSIAPGQKRCKLVRAHTPDRANYQQFRDRLTVLRADSERLDDYGHRLSAQWTGAANTPVVER